MMAALLNVELRIYRRDFQARSLSKPWKSLIHSPKFIADYRVQKRHLLVSYGDTKGSKPKYMSIVDDDTFPQQKRDLTVPVSPNSSIQLYMDSAHGLLCFSHENTVVLWNPAIRKTVSINVHNLSDLSYKTVFGFGVCPDTCDPKLVKMVFDCNLKESYTVEIFTLSSGVWRSPHSNLPRKSICFKHGLYIDGRIYWCSYDYFRLPDGSFKHFKLIISFATTSEEFTEINLPNSLRKARLGMSSLKQSLIVIEHIPSDQVYGIWMMMNHGDPTSFKKLFSINLADASVTHVFGFRNSGEAIVGTENDEIDALYVYEPSSKQISLLEISHPYSLSSYTETLLLLDH